VPENTIVATTEAALRGLLEASSGVSDIHYKGGVPAADLVIPSGKTVYADASSFTLTAHLAVEQGATLVIVDNLTTATAGNLLVNGTVKVGPGAVLVATAATDVTSYTVETTGALTAGTATVIGTSAVQVLKNGRLQLAATDVAAADKTFTLATAWAAAGEGHLIISGVTTFTVSELVALATETRGIGAATSDTTVALPAVIPVNTHIAVTGAVTDTADTEHHKLTVNGELDLSSTSTATLAGVKEIEVGDGGKFTSTNAALATTALTKITVGKGATFSTTGNASGATYAEVTQIEVGAGSAVTLNAAATLAKLASLDVGASSTFSSAAATAAYAALTTLSVGDYATATLAGTSGTAVTFATAGLGTLTLGKNATVDAGASSAVVKGGTDTAVSISKDATLSGIKIKAGTTLTVATGATLTVGGLLTVDGTLSIAGTGNVLLTAATTSVVVNAGGAIDVLAATGKFGEATQTATKITVAGTATNAKVDVTSTGVWTVTTHATGTDISGTGDEIVLGTLALNFDGTSAVTAVACVASTTSAAAGKLIAGAGTTITFAGS
jgi:hypothetical protein